MIFVENLSIQVGAFRLQQVGFDVPSGQYAVLMGQTGSGKTTLLEAICGLAPIESGRIRLMGTDVASLRPAERGIGYVPQDGALFTTMTVREHLAFSLVLRKWSRHDVRCRVDELASLLGVGHLLDRRPRGLSGGERQRVALGRALACKPGILCLDEPLSALDEKTRAGMCDLLKNVQRHTGVTTLHVTHNRDEAELLADRLLILRDGVLHHVTNGGSASESHSAKERIACG